MPSALPPGFPRFHDEEWVHQPLGELALKYDTVENHGWYSNLEPTLDQLAAALGDGSVLVDYSGGTGILADKLLHRIGDRRVGIVIADASPKFLRLALEKLRGDDRVAFRWLRWIKPPGRLASLDEVLEPPLRDHGVDALSSTNAIHLYSDLVPTLRSWARVLKPGAPVFVQSGNIGNPAAGKDEWIIDETVGAIDVAARRLVREDPRWAAFRDVLDDASRMAKHDAVRHKFFLPVRPLSDYRAAFDEAGLRVVEVAARRIDARSSEWRQFLSAYHEGVLGWAGGTERVEGVEPSESVVAQRLELIGEAMRVALGGADHFPCCWTYITARTPD